MAQEGTGGNAAWAVRVVATFVGIGGLIGGSVIGIVLPLIVIATWSSPQFDPVWIIQFPLFALFAAAYGIAIGLPASLLTGVAYIAVPRVRERWPLTAFGAAASAAWGAVIVELMMSPPTPLETYGTMAAIFAVCGAIAAHGCYWLLTRWDLHRSA